MFFHHLLGLALAAAPRASAVELTGYEYIVVGSGAGGGPLAARLAMAGHKTLLIEAGNDQGNNVNVTVPAYSTRATEDEKLSWAFYVRHYPDDEQQARDWKTSYRLPNGTIYTGLSPPEGAEMLGTFYPRAGTLGGCTAHNALLAVYPFQSDFQYIADLTGDEGWLPDNMRQHFIALEDKNYPQGGYYGHGQDGWLSIEIPTLTTPDPELLSVVVGGAYALGNATQSPINLTTLATNDLNADTIARDYDPSYYEVPISTRNGTRNGSRDFVVAVRDALNPDGSKKYPLDVRLNCFVTKITFDDTDCDETGEPVATGVEFLDGEYLYRASPLSSSSSSSSSSKHAKHGGKHPNGTPGSAKASREVIISGGTYNSPQILKLSGIGPQDELSKFGIPVVVDLPGVGGNLQDHYEISVNVKVPQDWTVLENCTFLLFDNTTDPCLDRWENPVMGDRGTYASNGVPVVMLYKSSAAEGDDWDLFTFGGPLNFAGYYPGYSVDLVAEHNWWTWAILKAHPRNRAGTVTLRSNDPLDTPEINFNYFEYGSGDYQADLTAMREGISLARDALRRSGVSTQEVRPGADTQSDEDLDQYIIDDAWGHHASSTCPIGPDGDPMAVLDSKFRVRGVKGLRVVDASVYPRLPGTFTQLSTYMAAEKAACDILEGLEDEEVDDGYWRV
ncbi:uncharacterized protein B0T23DRAFT_53929 [Neurospora hispaniola]|uniref:Glucose-methanol-choline oxidoreductase N-terminal domain-containing protein n=1 Tax=Neurospora hispaniola TaxID=588809 RepID=A0AAJ0HYV2_9PEZI|nr:hypothetical protein B0T23DRAFT_53929 [Neurospora hispaniola]